MGEPETLFKAMADQTRQRTLRLLSEHELSVSELVQALAQPQSTVSRHLRTLKNANLIHDRRDGANILYSVRNVADGDANSDLAAKLLAWIREQPLSVPVAERLGAILRQRRAMSEEFFDRVGKHWDNLREQSFGQTFHLEGMLSVLPREWVIADIGTGTGYMLPVLANHFRKVIAVEPADKMLEVARHRVGVQDTAGVELLKGDFGDLPIPDEAVDLALAMLVLHHVPVPRDALRELWRVLVPGRQVLIVEQESHDDGSFKERMQDHWSGFDRSMLTEWVASAGFSHVECRSLVASDRTADAPALFAVTGVK